MTERVRNSENVDEERKDNKRTRFTETKDDRIAFKFLKIEEAERESHKREVREKKRLKQKLRLYVAISTVK